MKLIGDFIFIVGIVLTLLILWILTRSPHKQLAKYILIVFFSFLLLVALNSYSILHNIRILYLLTTLFDDIVIVLVGPLLFLYIKALFLERDQLLKRNMGHFIPVILYFLFITLPFFLNDVFENLIFPHAKTIKENLTTVIILSDSYLIFYLFLSLRLFNTYRDVMKVNFSNLSERDFGWVRSMLIGALVVIGFDLIILLLDVYVNSFSLNVKFDMTVVAMIIFIGYLGYYGVNQSKILVPDFLIKEEVQVYSSAEKVNYLSGMTDAEIEDMKSRLEVVFLIDKPYLDEGLTLGRLAQFISISDKKLSTLLNQHMNTTFYDIINKYRVAAVKEKISSGKYDGLTLLGIAYESGFKSKTSFNRIFKKETGKSPSEFKKSL